MLTYADGCSMEEAYQGLLSDLEDVRTLPSTAAHAAADAASDAASKALIKALLWL
jgi:hypothetical protein